MAAFWKEVEAWIRTPAEEDVGWLEYEVWSMIALSYYCD
jgi:hypothetical protein